MALKRIVLHVGMPKTGTSTIQETLYHNHAALLGHGVLYPQSLPHNHTGFLGWFNPRHGRMLRHKERHAVRLREHLAEEVAATPADTLILSSEIVVGMLPGEIKPILRYLRQFADTFETVVFTRHPLNFANSAIQENVKSGRRRLGPARRVHINGPVYGRYIRRMERVIGPATVYSFEEAVKTGLTETLLSGIRPGADIAIDPVPQANTAICDEAVRFLNAIGASIHDLNKRDQRALHRLKGQKGTLLTVKQQAELWENSKPEIAYLRRNHGIDYACPEPVRGPAVSQKFRASAENVSQKMTPRTARKLRAFLDAH